MSGTAEKRRGYSGPVFLSGGFRPFFLFGAIWAALSMALWIGIIAGGFALPTAFDPVDWHAHELIFGYGAAIVCGFLLTAVPNWTGRLPVMGWPLAALTGLWIAGRLAVTFGGGLPALAVALIDLAFLGALAAVVAREIWAGANWRNLVVVVLIGVLLAANGVFHYIAAWGSLASAGTGGRLGAAVLIMLISVIGGRVVPSFTRNWLARQDPGRLPVPPNRFDQVTLLVSGAALIGWVGLPELPTTGIILAIAGILQVLRLLRWAGDRTLAEPLVLVLHVAYAFVPIGFLLAALSLVRPEVSHIVGLHAWMTGAVGLMTLAMMTRASLGHSGRELRARPVETAIYLMATGAVIARIVAGMTGGWLTLNLSGLLWIGAFGLFALAYWPILTKPRLTPKKPMPAPTRG